MSTRTDLVTVAEYQELPSTEGGHYELHHGEVVFVTAPKWGHKRIQDRVEMILRSVASERAYVTKEMAFRPTPEHEVWEADVGLVSAERAAKVGDDDYLMGAPELVIEVLSFGNTVEEMIDKTSICLENGCLSFWVLDSKRKRVSVTEGDVTRHYGISQTISSLVLNAPIPVRSIFE